MAALLSSSSPLYFLEGGGASGELIRSIDWSKRPIGPAEKWPETLKTALAIALNTRQPMFLMWGKELTQFYNDAYMPTFGVGKHPAAMGASAPEFWPESWHIIGLEVKAVMERGESTWHRDAPVPNERNGKIETVYWTYGYSPIRLPDGKIGGILVVCSETTDKVMSDRRLIAEAEKNRRLLKQMPTPFFSIDRDWVLSYFNPAAEEVLGLKSEDFIGKTLWDAFPGLQGSRLGLAYERAIREGTRVVCEDYYPNYDRWYEAWAYPLDGGLGVSFHDVTERKATEIVVAAEKQKLEAIFFGSVAPLVFFRGPDLIYDMYNEAYHSLVPKRDLRGKPLLEALPELKGTAFPELIQQVFNTGVPIQTVEELAPLKDPVTGATVDRYFRSGISRITDGMGNPYGVLVQVMEVTDQVVARKKVEQALSVRDTFLSIASHELRTPITGMKLQTQMLKRSIARKDPNAFTPDRVTKLVHQSDEGLTKMARLVEDMLDISRIESGKLTLDPEPTDIVALVRHSIESFSEELKSAEIPVRIEADPPVITILIDRFRMEQVLTNFITNTIRYASRAPVTISMSAAAGKFRLVFQDEGPGIPKEHRERIFERFERVVSANEISGLGLGLYIVRQIVQAHSGEVHVEEGIPRGARFVIELPYGG